MAQYPGEINRFEELIGPMPDRALRRWAITFLFLLIVLLGLGYVLKIANSLAAPIVITSYNPPVRVMAPASGLLREIRVTNRTTVTKGQILARVETELTLEELKMLEGLLSRIMTYPKNPEAALALLREFPEMEGEIALQVAGIIQDLEKYRNVLRDPTYARQLAIFADKKEYHQRLQKVLDQELESKKKELALERNQFAINKSLFDSDVIAKVQFLEAQRALLTTELAVQNQQRELEKNQLEISSMENDLNSLIADHTQNLKTAQDKLDERLLNFQSSLHAIEHANHIEAPADGLLEFVDVLDRDQYLASGELLFQIIPEDNRVIGRLSLPETNTAALRPGQTVRIKLNKYPAQEWGILKGEVASITSIPIDGEYRVRISFPNGLQTSYRKTLPYLNQLEGRAEIILDKKPFLSKVFDRLVAAWDENTR